MLHRFQVAGLPFSLDLPDSHPAADLLHNYDPFTITSLPGSQPLQTVGAQIFELKVGGERPEGTREVLFKAKEESGEPVVGLFRQGDGYLAEFAPQPGAPVCGGVQMSGDFRTGRLWTGGSPAGPASAA